MKYRILLVDDDRENLEATKNLLTAVGYNVTLANSGPEAIKLVRQAKRDFSLILMDYHMPKMLGSEVIQEIKKISPNQQILAFTLDDTKEAMRANFLAGATDFLDKNSDNDTLLAEIANRCAKYDQLYRTIDSEDLPLDEKMQFIQETGMIGSSDNLYQLCKDIRKVAPASATTMILGESGTGKELVAKALHKFSGRPKDRFVAVNIAAESPLLLDSSLFGHRKGAFTGATENQVGKFELADKGTLFLDEIGDMPYELQVKLLRVLQEREITPVGATKARSVDVRIIAATHKDLKKMVEAGTFREDLYYRLFNLTLETIPLRDRPEDIEPLIAQFTNEVCGKNRFDRSFHRSCLEQFRAYHWPGNVRELRSAVERHLLCAESNVVRKDDLDAVFFNQFNNKPVTLEEIDAHLDGIKKSHIAQTLKMTPSRAEAARRLNIAQNGLQYFINKWNL
ncbi:sigma-54 dependent transcriptional regulator [Bdellovibrio sp.]|uniref:sigma-54-dependent transcriptional regulator n=1 Tax=Bdellovibrio sp. TaxID=28201 RepID=UPI0032218CCD